jgi:sugar ABC superfamily ATP binding cassette transporter, membrane protein
VGATVFTLLTNSMVAYALGRNMHRPWFRRMYYYFVAALFVPFPIIMLPVVKETALLHLDNEAGLILLYVVYGLAFNILMYTSFIKAIPEELEEAAAIDGASRWQIFWRIIFPLLSPMNATVGILTCLWAWNDFLLPLVILTDQTKATLPLAQYVFQGQFNTNYPVSFASYLMAIAPMFLVYVFAQRWVISGVMRGSQK